MTEKRKYETPEAQKIEFDYKEQVVASGEPCDERFVDTNWNSPGLALCGYRYTD